MNAKRIPFVLAFVLTATGCGASEMASAAPTAMPASAARSEAAPAPQTPSNLAAAPPVAAAGAKTAPPDAKKGPQADNPDVLVVYNGDLAMIVDDGKVATTIDRIIDASEQVGGHLAGRRDGAVSVRIPSARFHEALEKIATFGEVTHQSVSAEDVSEEYHDAEVRLQNLKATQKRLQEFLARSANMADMLTLEHELERVSMDIDRMEGRMRFLRDHAAFSTLSVALSPRPKTQPIVVVDPKAPPPPPRILAIHAPWLDSLGVPSLVAN